MFPDMLLANVFGGMPAFLRGVVRATPIQNNIIGREEPEKPRMTVANKVALYAEVPAASILLFGLAAIVIYPTITIESRVGIVSPMAASITVLFIVSKRLRDSAFRKLEFLNKKALSPALKASRGTVQNISVEQPSIYASSQAMLNSNGSFLRIRLYPKSLVDSLDRAKTDIETYNQLFQRVCDEGYKKISTTEFNIWAVLKGLGFDVEVNYPEPIVSLAQEMFGYLLKLSPDLNSFPIKGREVLEIKADIVEKLKKFFVDNLLEEVETPHAAL